VTYLGAIATFRVDDVDLAALDGHRHLHMTSYFLQTGLRPSFPAILRHAKRAGLTTSFDPNSDPRQTWSRGFRTVLAHTDMLFLNDREATAVTGKRTAAAAARSLGDAVSCVVVKRGAKGAVASFEGREYSSPGFRVETTDTTGAGDSFAAGFVSAWLEGHDVDRCLREANACGALSTRRAGGTAAQADAAELRRFLRANPDGATTSRRGGARGRRSDH
jgi:sugar/nucleoside kinase (ribokinase family)